MYLRHRRQDGVGRDVVVLDVRGLLRHPVARRRQVRQRVLPAILQEQNINFNIEFLPLLMLIIVTLRLVYKFQQ